MKSALGYLVAFIASFSMWCIVEYILRSTANKVKNKGFNFMGMIFQAALAGAVIMVGLGYCVIPLLLQAFPTLDIPAFSTFQISLYSAVAFLFVF